MRYHFNLQDNLFEEIKNKTKTIEARAQKHSADRYKDIKKNDVIEFENTRNHEILITKVLFVHSHKSLQEMFEKEGVEKILPHTAPEDAEKLFLTIDNYKERIKKFGIYAIGIEVVE